MPQTGGAIKDELNDYELLYMIHSKEETALKMLLDKYSGYLWKISREIWNDGFPGWDVDDLVLIAREKLIEACESYNEQKGACFNTYMTMCVIRRLASLKRKAVKEKMRYPTVSLDALSCGTKAEGSFAFLARNNQQVFEPEFYVQYKELITRTRRFIDQLSEPEKRLWDCMTKGLGYKEGAVLMGMSKKTYDNALYRLRKKFRSYLAQSEFD